MAKAMIGTKVSSELAVEARPSRTTDPAPAWAEESRPPPSKVRLLQKVAAFLVGWLKVHTTHNNQTWL